MLSHSQIWSAIDNLAQRHELSVSALAKKAGLDPTTFNKSKRTSPDGRPRWPSTESISRILEATGASMADFMTLMAGGKPPPARPVPLIGLAEAGAGGFFDDGGFPVGSGWDAIRLPAADDENAYALEVSGESMLPLYRDGDTLIVSPAETVRRGDRVVVKTTSGEVMAKVLARRTERQVELESLNPDHGTRVIPANEIDWIARVVWASQ